MNLATRIQPRPQIILILCCLLLSWLAPGQTEAQSVTADGTFAYEIPIVTPPGTRGMKPEISLAYDSNNPNGLIGVGWTIKGISMISRDNAYTIRFDGSDHYNLDGAKLIYNSGTGCYHKEYEDYSKIQAFNLNAFATSSYWMVTHKNGYKYYYGNTPDSHINGYGRGLGAIVWALNKVVDPLGNYYTISYYEEIGGEFAPRQIRYSDNDTYNIAGDVVINFIYGTRNDHHVRYMPTKVDMDIRLHRISVELDDPDGTRYFRWYDLKYDYSGNTGRSLLTSVQEFGTHGDDLPPITFTWDEGGDVGFETPTLWLDTLHQVGWLYGLEWPFAGGNDQNPLNLFAGLVDLNSDGLLDRLYPVVDSIAWPNFYYDLLGALSNGGGFGTASVWIDDVDWGSTDGDFWVQRGNDNGEIYNLFLDMDGDRLPDRVSYKYGTTYGLHVGKNTGTNIPLPPAKWLAANAWGQESDRYPQSGDYFGSTSHLLADMNGDDLPDRVAYYYYGNGLYVGLNNGSTFDTPTLWLGANAWGGNDHWPRQANESVVFREIRDMNGDGLPDRLSNCYNGNYGLWVGFNNGTGFDSPLEWLNVNHWGAVEDQYPLHKNTYGEIFRQLKDVNGDGLPDRLSISYDGDPGLYVALNNGRGFDNPPTQWLDDYAWGNAEDKYPQSGDKGATIMTALQDMNADGLPDRVAYKYNGVAGLWVGINNGHGFNSPQKWLTNTAWGPEIMTKEYNDNYPRFGSTVGTNIYKMLIDMNGDGLPDRVGNTYSEDQSLYVGLSKARLPDKMTGIGNGQGGEISVDYQPASQVPNAVLGQNHASANYTYGKVADTTPRALVTKLTKDDGLSESSFSYKYFKGMLANGSMPDRAKLGFYYIDKVNDATGNYTRTIYNQSKPYQRLVEDVQNRDSSNNILTRKMSYYASKTDTDSPAGVRFVYLTNNYNYVYWDDSFVRTRQLYEYDAYGNVRRVYDYGQDSPAFTGDESEALTEFNYNNITWVLDKPKKNWQNGYNINNAWVLQRQTQYYYDELAYGSVSKGELTKELFAGPGYNVTIEHEYGARGNLWKTKDGKGNTTTSGFTTHYSADLSYVINELDQTTNYNYDSFRRLLEEEDVNGVSTYHQYDQFSRPTKSYVTPDNLTYPTEERVYDFNGYVPECLILRQREEAGTDNVYETRTYFDGFGRVIQEKSEGSTGVYYETVDYMYDSEGQLVRQSVCYNTTTFDYRIPGWSQPYTATEYDAAGRVTKVTGPDGTYTQTIYEGNTVTSVDQLGFAISRRYDGQGNVIEVKEYTGIYPSTTEYANTVYKYNSGTSHLISITDDKSNEITYTYDILGQRTHMSHPDRGEWDYVYDYNGNVKSQTDGRRNTITYEHDELDRPVSVTHPSGSGIQYHYDETGHGSAVGRLTRVDYPVGSESFTYDVRGNVISQTVTIDGKARTEDFTFDSMNRLSQLIYPDGEDVDFTYDLSGALKTVKGADNYVLGIGYKPDGRPTVINFGNGADMGIDYYDLLAEKDPSSQDRTFSQRVRRMYVTGHDENYDLTWIMDNNYQYDVAGNVKTKLDNLDGNYSEYFGYDHLNRLTFGYSNTYNFKSFSYDEIGNMTSKDGTEGIYTDHKLTSKNGISYVYDDNGNMISAGANQFWYDYDNRMVLSNVGSSFVFYQYFGQRRVRKTEGDATTYYFFRNYEEKELAGATKVLTEESTTIDALAGSGVLSFPLRVDKAGGGGGGGGQVEPDTLVTVVPDSVSTNVTPGSGKPEDYEIVDYRFASVPVLVATINTENGGDNCHHDISTVTADDFWARVEEDASADFYHTTETLGYMVIEPGTYDVGLKKLHAGVVSAVHETWRSATFPQAFSTTPVVVATIDTEAGGDNCHVDITSVTSSGFSVRVEEDLSRDGTHGAAEDIGYLALEPGIYGVADKFLMAALISGVDHNWFQVTFPITFPEVPVVVANINTEAGGQSCQIDVRSLTTNGFQVRCEEDMSCDGAHAKETIGYIAMVAGSFSDFGGSFLVDRVDMNHNWVEAVFPEPESPPSDGPVKYYEAGDMRVARRSGADGLVFIHQDHLGSASRMTDANTYLIKKVGYTPYGSDAYEVNLAGDPELNYKFTGKEQDSSDLYYYGARYYDPNLGRFTTADDLITDLYYPQALNPYSYCYNNPVKYVDPSGNSVLGAILVGAVVGGAMAYLSGDDIIEGMLMGGLSGAFSYYMTPFLADLPGFTPLLAEVVSASISGAIQAGFTGGDVFEGAVYGGVSGGVGHGVGNAVAGKLAGNTVVGQYAAQIGRIAGGAAGGAVSGAAFTAFHGGNFSENVIGGAKMGGLSGGISVAVQEVVRSASSNVTSICFVAGTPVWTEEGMKNIEDVQIGDMVLSRDEETGETGFKPVIETIAKETGTLVEITLVGGEVIQATPEHPFRVVKMPVEGTVATNQSDERVMGTLAAQEQAGQDKDGQWLKASGLTQDAHLLTAEGEILAVEAVGVVEKASPVSVYNITVADWHTYHVGNAGLWVHNDCDVEDQETCTAKDESFWGDASGGLFNKHWKDLLKLGVKGTAVAPAVGHGLHAYGVANSAYTIAGHMDHGNWGGAFAETLFMGGDIYSYISTSTTLFGPTAMGAKFMYDVYTSTDPWVRRQPAAEPLLLPKTGTYEWMSAEEDLKVGRRKKIIVGLSDGPTICATVLSLV